MDVGDYLSRRFKTGKRGVTKNRFVLTSNLKFLGGPENFATVREPVRIDRIEVIGGIRKAYGRGIYTNKRTKRPIAAPRATATFGFAGKNGGQWPPDYHLLTDEEKQLLILHHEEAKKLFMRSEKTTRKSVGHRVAIEIVREHLQGADRDIVLHALGVLL